MYSINGVNTLVQNLISTSVRFSAILQDKLHIVLSMTYGLFKFNASV